VREGREDGTGSGFNLGWAVGSFLLWAETFSPGPFSYFSLLYFFSFSIFLISFIDFAKNAPNQIKPLSEILQNSQQGFKPIGNKFSEPKQDF
jgi:hypothetical protein